MPARKKTAVFELNQWEANEYPKRLDFVEDNARIEKALVGLKALSWDFDQEVAQGKVAYTMVRSGTESEPIYTETLKDVATRTTWILSDGRIKQRTVCEKAGLDVTKVLIRTGTGVTMEVET